MNEEDSNANLPSSVAAVKDLGSAVVEIGVSSVQGLISTAGSQVYKVTNVLRRQVMCANDMDSDSCKSENDSSEDAEMQDIQEALGLKAQQQYFFAIDDLPTNTDQQDVLEQAIEKCKQMILESEERSERRFKLIRVLVELRFRLQELREGPLSPLPEGSQVVMGHPFVPHASHDDEERYCEKCCRRIWIIEDYYSCDKCYFKCHGRCLNSITRKCAYQRVRANPNYISDICPERGLSHQRFRCFECKRRIFLDTARRCDYNGNYYCSNCHWNSEAVIPARVIHNWDFVPRKVCRASVQFLRLMVKKPVINLEEENPKLFNLVEELANIRALREEILMQKLYLRSCRDAQERRLLWLLNKRQHFVERSESYSLQDLIDLKEGTLLKYLTQVHGVFNDHIMKECESCRGKGFLCGLCESPELIFPMTPQTVRCLECGHVYHSVCHRESNRDCFKCALRQKRKSTSNTPISFSDESTPQTSLEDPNVVLQQTAIEVHAEPSSATDPLSSPSRDTSSATAPSQNDENTSTLRSSTSQAISALDNNMNSDSDHVSSDITKIANVSDTYVAIKEPATIPGSESLGSQQADVLAIPDGCNDLDVSIKLLLPEVSDVPQELPAQVSLATEIVTARMEEASKVESAVLAAKGDFADLPSSVDLTANPFTEMGSHGDTNT